MNNNRSNFSYLGKYKFINNKMSNEEDSFQNIESGPNYISNDDEEQINQEGILKTYMTP